MPQTSEYTAVVPGSPELLFGAVKHQDEWAHKMVPQVLKEGKRHQGDGESGSVYHFDVHEDAHDAHGGNPKVQIVLEDYNVSTLSLVQDYQADPSYKHVKFHVRFLPGPSPGTSYLKWVIDYDPVSDDTPPPNDFLTNLPYTGLKDLAAYLESAKSEKQVTDNSAPRTYNSAAITDDPAGTTEDSDEKFDASAPLTDDTPPPEDLVTKSPLAGFSEDQ